MRTILLILSASIALSANPKELNSFNSSFTQTITDEHKKVIKYSGELWASKPQSALWVYKKPINKKIYINGTSVTIIEPDLEQAIIKRLDDDIDFLAIIKNAKKLKNNHYVADVQNQKYNITLADGVVKNISYKDEFDNKIDIKFDSPKQNTAINESIFKPSIPSDFDIIR